MSDTEQEVIPGFELDSGSAFDDYTGTCVDAYFSTDATYNSGKTLCLIATFESEELDKPQRELFACGDGWMQGEENGETAVRADGAKKNFVKNSKIGYFIQGAIASGAAKDMVRLGGDQFHAKSYVGLKFHLKTEEVDYGKTIGKQRVKKPVEYFGVDESVVQGGGEQAAQQPVQRPTAAPAVTQAPAVAPAVAQAPTAAPPTNDGIEPEMRMTLVNLAEQATDHADFMEKAFALPGVEDNPKLSAAVLSRKPGGIWATAAAAKG